MTQSGGNSTAPGGIASVTDFSSLVALLFSLGALRDWLKLYVNLDGCAQTSSIHD
jgi:hypothetical protein